MRVKLRNDLRHAWSLTWAWLRQVSGDAAYENYVRYARREDGITTGSAPLLSRGEFYLDSLRRRYSTVSRCC